MNKKQWIGAFVAFVGVLAIGYSINAMNRIEKVKEKANFFTRPTGNNPIGRTVNSKVQQKAHGYETQVKFLMIGGVMLILVGGGAVYFLRKR